MSYWSSYFNWLDESCELYTISRMMIEKTTNIKATSSQTVVFDQEFLLIQETKNLLNWNKIWNDFNGVCDMWFSDNYCSQEMASFQGRQHRPERFTFQCEKIVINPAKDWIICFPGSKHKRISLRFQGER